MDHLKMYFLLNMRIFHCSVSLLEGIWIYEYNTLAPEKLTAGTWKLSPWKRKFIYNFILVFHFIFPGMSILRRTQFFLGANKVDGCYLPKRYLQVNRQFISFTQRLCPCTFHLKCLYLYQESSVRWPTVKWLRWAVNSYLCFFFWQWRNGRILCQE